MKKKKEKKEQTKQTTLVLLFPPSDAAPMQLSALSRQANKSCSQGTFLGHPTWEERGESPLETASLWNCKNCLSLQVKGCSPLYLGHPSDLSQGQQ